MFEKIKKKIKDNPEDVMFYTILGATIAGGTALFIAAYKEQAAINEANAKAEEEFQNWSDEQHSNGNVVVQLSNGNYIGVPPQSLVS